MTDSLDDETRAQLRAMVAALPPLTDEQVDALADVIVQIRLDHARRAGEQALSDRDRT